MRVKFGFATVLVALMLASGSAIADRPDGISYEVDVKTSFGTEFTDCFIFTDFGILNVVGLGWPLAFDQANLGTHEVFWLSVTLSGGGFQIAFNGMATGNEFDGMLKGNAINEFGDTFVFKGGPSDCGQGAPDVLAASPGFNWVQ